jgi:hypothetical protein
MAETSQLRPAVFIGSSKEGLGIAEAIQVNLDHACEVTVWSQGVFGLGEGSLEALVDRLESFDFAILVLTPDDVTTSRDVTQQSPRDNVLLELGLFIGALGRKRSFIVYDRNAGLKLPSDLAGVTPATFQMHADGNLRASLGAATTLIKGSIQQLGRFQRKFSAEIDVNTQFQIIHDLLDHAPEQFMIWMHEANTTIVRTPSLFGPGIRYVYQMRNQAGGQGGFFMDELCRKLADAALLAADLRQNVSLTPRGKQFAQWLVDNGHKASYFKSDIAEWGTPPSNPAFTWPPAVFGRPVAPPSTPPQPALAPEPLQSVPPPEPQQPKADGSKAKGRSKQQGRPDKGKKR